MIKKIIISTINFYQLIISTTLKNIFGMPMMCRYDVTCSEYSKREIEKNGLLRGGKNSAARILKCNPFVKASNQTKPSSGKDK